MSVCVVGLGRVGCAVAAALADRGVTVVGVDADPGRVAVANGEVAPDLEPGLAAALLRGRQQLSATTSHLDAVRSASITYVIVPTPSDHRGAYELGHVLRAFEQIGQALMGTMDAHTVVLASTVLPGSTRYGLQPVLERAAGRAVGDGLSLCYSPPFIALGSVIRDFLNPDFAMLGVADESSGAAVEMLYRRVLGPDVPIKSMSIENAELTKLAINTFLTAKITFANTLAALCDHLPGGNVDIVTDAIGADCRIGPRLLTGGLGYGGPCLPRDNAALAFLARSLGVPTESINATDRVNQSLTADMVAALVARFPAESSAVIMGLTYKSGTMVVEASPGIDLARAFARAGMRVFGYDPHAAISARAALAKEQSDVLIQIVDEADCPNPADLVVLATPDATLLEVALRLQPKVLADPWRFVTHERWPIGTEVVQYGRPDPARVDEDHGLALRRLWSQQTEALPPVESVYTLSNLL